MDENPLAQRSPKSSHEALRTVFDAYSNGALAMAINILGNRDDAEDACQETFLQVYRNLDRYDAQRSFKTWFCAILYRRCLDQLRRRRRSLALVKKMGNDPVAVATAAPFSSTASRSLPAGLLNPLTTKERTALCLWANDGFTAGEIAQVLRCSPGTARVYLFQARRKIKKILERDHELLQRC